MKRAGLATLLAALAWIAAGCSKTIAHRPFEDASAAAVARPVSPGATGFRYPSGRWRLATLEALDRATLWFGHIAIRHESSQVELLRPPAWRPDPPAPKRSIAEALALAERIQSQAALAPDTFEQLAREYSEDVASKDLGGMLGGVRASQLTNSDFLDALTVLKAGEVSKVFRTPYGFHILKRYAPPLDEPVSGARIVVGYEGVYALAREVHRSRAEALRLATEIAAQARKDPGNFSGLVDRYSDNIDRATHGDLGLYATRDPGFLPTEVQALASLKAGQIAGPIDGRFGFEILERVPSSPRKEYAMTAVEVTADGHAGDPDAAMAEALQTTEGLLGQLRAAPDRFQEFQSNYCCTRIQRWTRGRGDATLSDILDGLAFGKIAPKPLRRPAGYILMKRLDPRAVPEPPRQFDVPNPSDPDYQDLASTLDRESLVAATRSFTAALRETSSLGPGAVAVIVQTLDKLAAYAENNPIDHVQTASTLQATLASLQGALGSEQFGRFKAFGRRWVIRQMMPPDTVD